jgi:hypothetical protein
MASSTSLRVSSLTRDWLASTRDTVAVETPAILATSLMLGMNRIIPFCDKLMKTISFNQCCISFLYKTPLKKLQKIRFSH